MNLPVRSSYRALIKSTSSNLRKYFRKDEVDRIISSCQEQGKREFALVVDFLWKTGVRASELISIRSKDVDSYAKTVRVITPKKSRRKARGRKPLVRSERMIPLPDDLLNRLNTYRIEKSHEEDDFIFPFTRSTIFRKVRAACALASFNGGRSHPHTFRHSYAVYLFRNGIPVTAVQKLLGHANIENPAIWL